MTFYPLSNASCAQRWNVRKNYFFKMGLIAKTCWEEEKKRKCRRLWILNVPMQK
jgi:hypothetical protein